MPAHNPVVRVPSTERRVESEICGYALPHSLSGSPRFRFWYWGVLRLGLGGAQIVLVLWCLALFMRDGLNARTMHIAFTGAILTTLSLLLFKSSTKGSMKE